MTIPIPAFKRLIVLFWALWWLIAFLTDFFGALKETGLYAPYWLSHTNYPALVAATAPYHPPGWLAPLLFAGIIAWSFLATVFYIIAAATPYHMRDTWRRRVDNAFIVSLGLWLAFFIADQIVFKFALEQNHMVQGAFQLLTWLALYVLPDEDAG